MRTRQSDPLVRDLDVTVTRATLVAQLESAIRADILNGTLEPGLRLRAADLSRQYGVSATPLREALRRLAAQKLVELGPRMGASVAALTTEELHDLYWLRGLLEGMALKRSIRRADDEWDQRVTEAYMALERVAAGEATTSGDVWAAALRSFRDALFSACDSRWLLRFVGVLSDHAQRYRMLSHRCSAWAFGDEHRTVYQAALDRDVDAAVAAHARHLTATVDLLTRMMSMRDNSR